MRDCPQQQTKESMLAPNGWEMVDPNTQMGYWPQYTGMKWAIHKLKNGNWTQYTGGKWGIGPKNKCDPCHKPSSPLSRCMNQVDEGTMVALFPAVVG